MEVWKKFLLVYYLFFWDLIMWGRDVGCLGVLGRLGCRGGWSDRKFGVFCWLKCLVSWGVRSLGCLVFWCVRFVGYLVSWGF